MENADLSVVSTSSILENLDGRRMDDLKALEEGSPVSERKKKIAKGDPISSSSSEEHHLNGDHVTTGNSTTQPEVGGRNGLDEGGGGGGGGWEEEEEVVDANGFRVVGRRETEAQWRTEVIRELDARTKEVRTRDVRQVALEESKSRETTTRLLLSPEEFDAILATSGARVDAEGGVMVEVCGDRVVEELVRVETERLETAGGVVRVATFTVTEEQRKTEESIGRDFLADPERIEEVIQGQEKVNEDSQDHGKVKDDIQGHEEVNDNIQGQEKFNEVIQGQEKVNENSQSQENVKEDIQSHEKVKDDIQGQNAVNEVIQGQEKVNEDSQGQEKVKEYIQELPGDVFHNGFTNPDGEESPVVLSSEGVVQPDVDSAATGSRGSILESGEESGSELLRKSKEVTWKPETEPGILEDDDENVKKGNKNTVAEGGQSSRSSTKGGLINYIRVKARSLSRDRSNRRAKVHSEDGEEKEKEDGKTRPEDGEGEKKSSKREREGEGKRAEKSEHKKFRLNLRSKRSDEEKVDDDVTRREGQTEVTSPEEADKEGSQQQQQQQQKNRKNKKGVKKGKGSKVAGSFGGDPERSTPGEEDNKEAGKEEGKETADGKSKEQKWFHFARKSDHVTKDDHVIEARAKEAPKWSIFGRKSRKPEPEVEVQAAKEDAEEEDWKEKSASENSNIELLSWKHLDDVDETKVGVKQAPGLQDDGANQTLVKTPEIEKEVKDEVQKKEQKKFSFGLKFGKKGKQPEEKETEKEVKTDEVLDTCTRITTDEQAVLNSSDVLIQATPTENQTGLNATEIVVLPPELPPSTESKVEPEVLELNLEALSQGVLVPDLPGFVLEPAAEEDIQPTFENLVCTDAMDIDNTACQHSLETTTEQEQLCSTVEAPSVEKSTNEEQVLSTAAQCIASEPDPEIFDALVSGDEVELSKDGKHHEIVEQEKVEGIRQDIAIADDPGGLSQEPHFQADGTGQQLVDISSGRSVDPDHGHSDPGILSAGEVVDSDTVHGQAAVVAVEKKETKAKTFSFGLKLGHKKEEEEPPHRQKTSWSPFSKKTGKKDKDTTGKEPQVTETEDNRARTPNSEDAKTPDSEKPEMMVEPSKGQSDSREGTLKRNKGLQKLFGFGKKPKTPDDKTTPQNVVTSSSTADAGSGPDGKDVTGTEDVAVQTKAVEKGPAVGGGGEEKTPRHKKFAFGLKFGKKHEKDPGVSQRDGKESTNLESGDADKSAGLQEESAKSPEQDSGTHPDADSMPTPDEPQPLAIDLDGQDVAAQSAFAEGMDSILIPGAQVQIDQHAENPPHHDDETDLDLKLGQNPDEVQLASLESAEAKVADNVETSTLTCLDENLRTEEEDQQKAVKHSELQTDVDITSNQGSQPIVDEDKVTGSNDVIDDESQEHRASAEVAVPEIDQITEISTMVECPEEVVVPEDVAPELSVEKPQEIARISQDPVDVQEPTTGKQDIDEPEARVVEIKPEMALQSTPEVEGVESEKQDKATDEESHQNDLGEVAVDVGPPGKPGSPLPSGKPSVEPEKSPVERLEIKVETREEKQHGTSSHHHAIKWPHFGKKKSDGKEGEDKDKDREGHTPGRTEEKESVGKEDKSSGKKTSHGIGKGFLKLFSPKKHPKSEEKKGDNSKDSSSNSIQDSIVVYSIEGEGHVVAETPFRSKKEPEEEEKEDHEHTQDTSTPSAGRATLANGITSGSREPEVDAATERPTSTETAPEVTSRPPGDGPGHFVVVAIDFGTTFSGYAFSFTGDPDSSIHMMRKWEGGDPGIVNQKTPTTILLNPEGRFHSFGFTARDFYHDLEASETERWMYFEKFKMALHHDAALGEETMVVASNGRLFPAITIFAHSLRFFRDHALKELTSQSSVTIDNDDVRWVITVPAIWKAPAKQFMRRAAYQAGIASPLHPDRLLIALEPEAASIYVRKLRMSQLVPDDNMNKTPSSSSSSPYSSPPRETRLPHRDNDLGQPSLTNDHVSDHLKAGTRYMVVDCGGGTVDITVHELETANGCLKELHKATGGPFGSTGVDRQFEALLCEIFGVEFIEAFKQKRSAGWVDLMIAFESRKRAANPRKDNPLNVSLPFSFIDFYKREYDTHVEAAVRKFGDRGVTWSVQGMLKLTPGAMIALFRPTLDGIKSSIYDVLSSPAVKGVEYLFLVGGFAESAVLQQEIRKEFGDKMRIIIPQDVSLTILKGAVCFGLDPTVVTVRKSRMTYGIGVVNRFDPSRHPESRRVRKDGTDWCTGVFDVFVRSGESVTLGDRTVRRYVPANRAQAASVIHVYCSESGSGSVPRYIDDDGVTRCATLRIGHPPQGGGDALQEDPQKTGDGGAEGGRSSRLEIETTMTFGDTEIGVVARDVATGLEVGSAIDFLNN